MSFFIWRIYLVHYQLLSFNEEHLLIFNQPGKIMCKDHILFVISRHKLLIFPIMTQLLRLPELKPFALNVKTGEVDFQQ
jgi:hypothetical protein